MNKSTAMLIATVLAVVSSGAFAQTNPNPAPDKTQVEKSKESGTKPKYDQKAAEGLSGSAESDAAAAKANVDASKKHARTKAKYDQNAAEALSGSAGSDAAAAKANVDTSKKTARQKPKNIKDMTPEERAALQKQMKEQAKP